MPTSIPGRRCYGSSLPPTAPRCRTACIGWARSPRRRVRHLRDHAADAQRPLSGDRPLPVRSGRSLTGVPAHGRAERPDRSDAPEGDDGRPHHAMCCDTANAARVRRSRPIFGDNRESDIGVRRNTGDRRKLRSRGAVIRATHHDGEAAWMDRCDARMEHEDAAETLSGPRPDADGAVETLRLVSRLHDSLLDRVGTALTERPGPLTGARCIATDRWASNAEAKPQVSTAGRARAGGGATTALERQGGRMTSRRQLLAQRLSLRSSKRAVPSVGLSALPRHDRERLLDRSGATSPTRSADGAFIP